MRILVSIDSDHYTDVYYTVVANNNEAVTRMCKSASKEQKLEVVENEVTGAMRISFDDGEGNFMVGQTFEVSGYLPYVVIHHHAYDGVDFDVVGSAKDSYMAEIVKRAAVSAYKEEVEYDEEDFDEPDQTCFDTGAEWDVFTVLDFSDVLAAKEVA